MRTIRIVTLAAFSICAVQAQQSGSPNPQAAAVLKSIAGKESQRAGDVFKNVDYLKDVTAERFLRIMDVGYSRGLGVNCDHCHVADKWESDEKRPKQAAREMQLMMREINQKLKTLQHLDNPEAVINCSTCHRGETQPSLATMPPLKTPAARPPQ
jgi:rubrerythrin